MGGYSSTPRKSKVSEEEGDESLFYAVSGMQGWRSSMEDAHIALLKVPHGQPPTAAAIGAARIGLFSSQSQKAVIVNSNTTRGDDRVADSLNNSKAGAPGTARVRAGTFSAGDTGSLSPPQGSPRNVSQKATKGQIQSVRGPRRASTAVDLLEDAALFGVFDGHGGKAVAEFCKERLPGLLAASPDIRAGNWKDGFPRVYHALDALLASGEGQEKAGGWGGSKVDGIGVGCTIVTALLDRKRRQASCYVAHAGDSRCVLCRAGRAVQLTRDHKPGMSSEYARIVAAGGHVSRAGRVNDNLNLSRAIGDMVYKRNHLRQAKDQIISAEPDVCRFLVTPGVDEFLILACDGVWEMMNTTQVVTFVRSGLRAGMPPREVCESLLDACLSPDPKGTRYAGCDNMTVLLVLLDGWESALASKAYTPALTFSGGRFGSVGEAAAALSGALPKIARPLNNVRPPLPVEFLAPKSAVATAAANGDKPATPAPAPGAEATTEDRTDKGSKGNAASNAKDVGATIGWPQERIAAGKVAPPRTAHGIEFSLATFSAPFVPIPRTGGSRMSTGSMGSRGAAAAAAAAAATTTAAASAAAGDLAAPEVARPRSTSQANRAVLPGSRRRNSNHQRSATAPMLPSPLLHHRKRRDPLSEERVTTAAAIAVLHDVGAAGAVATALAGESATFVNSNLGSSGQSTTMEAGGKAGQDHGRQAPPSEGAGLVFVSAEAVVDEVSVTAVASPSKPPNF
ncbi:unnamed protein product [Scytosiphon promiscuus]